MSAQIPMATLEPLEVATKLGIPLHAIAVRLDVTDRWARELVRNPRHRRRVLLAELEIALEHLRFEASVASLFTRGVPL
jgi:hypothetical protein